MIDLDLEAIKKQLAEISPWPWMPENEYSNSIHVQSVLSSGDIVPVFDSICSLQVSNCPNWRIDRDFIAQAPQTISKLVAEVERLEKVNAKLADDNFSYQLNLTSAEEQIERLTKKLGEK